MFRGVFSSLAAGVPGVEPPESRSAMLLTPTPYPSPRYQHRKHRGDRDVMHSSMLLRARQSDIYSERCQRPRKCAARRSNARSECYGEASSSSSSSSSRPFVVPACAKRGLRTHAEHIRSSTKSVLGTASLSASVVRAFNVAVRTSEILRNGPLNLIRDQLVVFSFKQPHKLINLELSKFKASESKEISKVSRF